MCGKKSQHIKWMTSESSHDSVSRISNWCCGFRTATFPGLSDVDADSLTHGEWEGCLARESRAKFWVSKYTVWCGTPQTLEPKSAGMLSGSLRPKFAWNWWFLVIIIFLSFKNVFFFDSFWYFVGETQKKDMLISERFQQLASRWDARTLLVLMVHSWSFENVLSN